MAGTPTVSIPARATIAQSGIVGDRESAPPHLALARRGPAG